MLYFWKANGPRTSKMIFWTVKYTNTQIQRHKYTNTLWWSAGNTQHVLYFRNARGPRTSKMIFWTVKNPNPNLKLWTTDPLTVFCTVPPGLFSSVFLLSLSQLENSATSNDAINIFKKLVQISCRKTMN